MGHLTDALGDELADCLMEMGASAATVERSGEGYPSSDTSGTAVVAFFTHDTSQVHPTQGTAAPCRQLSIKVVQKACVLMETGIAQACIGVLQL